MQAILFGNVDNLPHGIKRYYVKTVQLQAIVAKR